jgi:phosphoglycolate phosphatase-like HAD superfamily hydrolase
MRAVGMGRGDGAASGGESGYPRFCSQSSNVKFIVSTIILAVGSLHAQDPVPSWNDTGPKKAIVAFVEKVTKEGSLDFVPPNERIATFDNDGTLWAEQPMYFQFLFAMDRVKALARQHPEWKTQEPFKSALAGDPKGLLASGEKGVLEIMAQTHAGMTTAEFDQIARDWFKTARHPRFNRPYNEMVYQPMLELLAYLRANGFKTFIVSGGGVEFMRAFAPDAYGIPPDQIVGSMGKLKYEMQNGKPVLIKLPQVLFIDDKAGKPEGIQSFIGQRPIFAFGNSDGDQQMLEWTAGGRGVRFMGLVHHDDAEREWAYDRKSHIGTLDKAWDEAIGKGWIVLSMKDDWKTVFPPAVR